MKVLLGDKGLGKSWQRKYEPTTKCVHCGGVSRIGFVAYEEGKEDGPFVCELHPNESGPCLHRHGPKGHEPLPKAARAKALAKRREIKKRGGGLWLHDCCAVAVYFCTRCLEATAEYTQG
jgi:hypothetical protein